MLIDLQHRSYEKELMDDPSVNQKDLLEALSDISRTNRWLGGNQITLTAVHNLCKNERVSDCITILDLGCGDAEMLRMLADSFRKKKKTVKLIGIDLSEKSIEHAKKMNLSYPEISVVQQDMLTIQPSQFSCDIVICTLTLHHLTNTEIQKTLNKALQLSRVGVVINDLHRSRIAYYLFKLFSIFFIKGHIAKYDGLISIKRGFKKQELQQFAKKLQIEQHRIDWKWAFRYRWIIKH